MSFLFAIKAIGIVTALVEAGYAGVFHLEGDRRGARSLAMTSLGMLIAAIIGPQV